MILNISIQELYGIKVRLIPRKDYWKKGAKRYLLVGTKQNIWIPNFCLKDDGTIIANGNVYQRQMLHYISIELYVKAHKGGILHE